MTGTSIHRTATAASTDLARPGWLPEAQWPFAIRRYHHRGPSENGKPGSAALAIHYTDEGQGPTLVFVHAGMWSFIWRDIIASLRHDFRCITLDFPGTGLSGGTANDVDIASYPAILNGLLDHLDVDDATVVVHDLGGAVGVVAAGERPNRVAGLVATNSFAWPPATRALRMMLGFMGSGPTVATLGTVGLIPRLTSTRFGVGRHFGRADRKSFLGPYRSRFYRRNFHRTMGSAADSTEVFQRAEAALTGPLSALPVLTVFGENNDQFGFADTWQTHFPNAERWTIPGGNHFPMCDVPRDYASRLRDWHHRCVAD